MAGVGVLGALGFVLWGESAWLADPERTGPLAEFLSLGELAAQVRVPFGQVLVLTIPVLLLLRFRKCVWGASIAAAFCLYPLFFLNFGSPLRERPSAKYVIRYGPEPAPATFLAANVLWTNVLKDDVFAMVRREDPDVVGLTEVSKAWRDAALAAPGGLLDAYPYHASASNLGEWNDEAWGCMLLSKHPIGSTEAPRLMIGVDRMRPFLEAVIEAPEGPITVQLLHPERPGRAWRLQARMMLLDQLAERETLGPRVVMGDFNTTTSSPVLRRFLAETGLQDSRTGFGRQPSWNHFPGQVPMTISRNVGRLWRPGVAIDHMFVSDGISVLERRTIPIPGSDHLAVLMTARY